MFPPVFKPAIGSYCLKEGQQSPDTVSAGADTSPVDPGRSTHPLMRIQRIVHAFGEAVGRCPAPLLSCQRRFAAVTAVKVSGPAITRRSRTRCRLRNAPPNSPRHTGPSRARPVRPRRTTSMVGACSVLLTLPTISPSVCQRLGLRTVRLLSSGCFRFQAICGVSFARGRSSLSCRGRPAGYVR